MRILLVDDDPEIRLIAGFMLRGAGHTVDDAEDAATAEAHHAKVRYDVIVMDVMLGEDDGIALAARLLESAVKPPRLVFLTGATRAEPLLRMRQLGDVGILHKPFDPSSFVATFHAQLSTA